MRSANKVLDRSDLHRSSLVHSTPIDRSKDELRLSSIATPAFVAEAVVSLGELWCDPNKDIIPISDSVHVFY
jgi:hypothetical protein